jgi:hypothetical protein
MVSPSRSFPGTRTAPSTSRMPPSARCCAASKAGLRSWKPVPELLERLKIVVNRRHARPFQERLLACVLTLRRRGRARQAAPPHTLSDASHPTALRSRANLRRHGAPDLAEGPEERKRASGDVTAQAHCGNVHRAEPAAVLSCGSQMQKLPALCPAAERGLPPWPPTFSRSARQHLCSRIDDHRADCS